MAITNVDKDAELWKLSSPVNGRINWCNCFEEQIGNTQQKESAYILQPNNFASTSYLRETLALCIQEVMDTKFCCRIFVTPKFGNNVNVYQQENK